MTQPLLTKLEIELLDTAKWAVDLLKMYDERMVQLGDPPSLVYSDVHKLGMQKADGVILKAEGLKQLGKEEV